ncbi:MAG: hypothetical protein GX661_03065 [Acholeplasmataceae bacterium]|nr:hypothetical protein [Acholeplasmataceae bacterium]
MTTYLQINNLRIGNYQITADFLKREVVGVFSRDPQVRLEVLKIFAGINRNLNTCLYDGNDIFDNPEYFRARIFLDYSHNYLSTLRTAIIEQSLQSKYNLRFNKEKFVRIAQELNVRGETEITHTYKFTPAGNTFVNYALTAALEKAYLIINNPTINLSLDVDIKYIVKAITDTQTYESVLLGLDSLRNFRDKLNKILIFTDYEQVFLTSCPTVVVTKQELPTEYKLFKGKNYLSLNLFSKEELKALKKNKIEYVIIPIFDMEDYL